MSSNNCKQNKIIVIKTEKSDKNECIDIDSEHNDTDIDDNEQQCKSDQTERHNDLNVSKAEKTDNKRWKKFPRCSKALLAIEHIEEDIDENQQIKALRAKFNDRIIGYRCKWYDCKFANRMQKQVEAHIRAKHTNYRPFKCTICDNCFINTERLAKHKKEVHSKQWFACDIPNCDFVAKTKQRLNNHMCSHVKPFACDWPECGQRFGRNSRLTDHKRAVHLKEYRFTCDWPGCDKVYTSYRSRNNHKMMHNERTFVCVWPECEFRCSRSTILIKHKKRHMKQSDNNEKKIIEKKYVCDWPECDKKFATNWNLSQHILVHRCERPFKCEWNDCERVFTEKGNMLKHLKTHSKQK